LHLAGGSRYAKQIRDQCCLMPNQKFMACDITLNLVKHLGI